MSNVVETVCRWNPCFREVNEFRGRYRILKGSAGSGKSTDIAQDYIKKLSDERYRGANLLVVRKVDETNRDSTFAELQAAIFRMFGEHYDKVWTICRSPLSMECRLTGGRIIFRGMKDDGQREKVKSITFRTGKLTWIWCEEATELSAADVDILDDRLRGELPNPNLFYQITMTFNPISSTHWIKARYFDRSDPEVLAHHSTYLGNRFIDDGYRRRMERRKIEDPEGYRIYGEGEWGEVGGLILTNIDIGDFNTDFDVRYLGQDFGFNHANAILDVGWRDGEIYIMREIYVHEMDTTEIIAIAEREKIPKNIEMFCDSAEPDRIRTWRKAGFRAVPVKKGAGSVKAQIDFLKSVKIHIAPCCVNTIKEITQWKWKRDRQTGAYLDEPVDFFDDAMAALRYSVERLRSGTKQAKILNRKELGIY